jgi:hypothetical protein
MPAAGLADVLVRDPDPLVGRGIGGHLLDQLPVLLLDVGVAGESALDHLESRREPVADPFELVHREDAGPTGGCNRELDPIPGEGGAEQPAESRLQGADLAA